MLGGMLLSSTCPLAAAVVAEEMAGAERPPAFTSAHYLNT